MSREMGEGRGDADTMPSGAWTGAAAFKGEASHVGVSSEAETGNACQ